MKRGYLRLLVVAAGLWGSINSFAFTSNPRSLSDNPLKYSSMNACVLAHFCSNRYRKCKDRCTIRWNARLEHCIAEYPEVVKQTRFHDQLKSAYQLNCRIDKLKTLVSQLLQHYPIDEMQKEQKTKLLKSLREELDKRFKKFYSLH